MKKQQKMIKAISLLFHRAFKWNPAYPVLLLCRTVIEILMPFPGIIFPAMIVDALLKGQSFREVLILVLGMAGSILLLTMLNTWTKAGMSLLQSGFKDHLNYEISEKQLHLSMEKIESVEVRELFVKANTAVSGDISYAARSLGGDRGVDAIGTEAVNLVSGVVRVVVLGVSLIRLGLIPAVVILAVLFFNMFGGSREKRASYAERVKTTPYRNKNQYVTNIMIDFRYAKEIRLFGLQEFLLDKFRQNKEHFYVAREEAKPAFYFSHLLSILGELVQMAATYGYLITKVLRGIMTLGEFIGYVAVFSNLSVTLVSIVQAYLNFNLYGEYFIDFENAMALEEEKAETAVSDRAEEDIARHAIVFQEVSFSYPGTNTKALDRVSLTIPLNGSVSIVGQNGSGKSTLIKLLLRLYHPDEGRIFLDGVDIATIPLEQYREKMAAVFQDYSIFALNIRENIAPAEGQEERIWDCLKQTGVQEVIQKLPEQLDTPLFRNYHPDGIDLSGGEKQKLAIARMLYKNTPIMVLDEPTAALDPRSELEIYEQVHRLAQDKVVLYISHRMSSCHFSDTILVLADGKVVDKGTHEELMEHKELYYRMYQSQAECYKGGEAV